MKMRKSNNNRVNYNMLVDSINNWLVIQETKNKDVENILEELDKNLCNKLQIVPNWKEKHLNTNTIILLEKLVPKDVTLQQIYVLTKRFLEYRTDTTDFRRIQNVYTLLRYYKNPEELQNFATNWKDIMGRKK